MSRKNQLKNRFVFALIAFVVMLSIFSAATFAWYVYRTNAHTTSIHMAVGTGVTLQISNSYQEHFGTTAVLEEFRGRLTPVSTDRIQNGFQKVIGFTETDEEHPIPMANLFARVDETEFYKTVLYIRSKGAESNVYLSNIGFEDDDIQFPISTGIRIGFLVHEPGYQKGVVGEYVFALNDAHHSGAGYNTWQGEDGFVLDSTRTDGSVVRFDNLLGQDNFCEYDVNTGAVTLKEHSVPILRTQGDGAGNYGEPTEVEVYIWLEGCDQDCTNAITLKSLQNVALDFANLVIE